MTAALVTVTFSRDLPFYRLAAKSIVRHVTGFSEIVVIVPTCDFDRFREAVAGLVTADGVGITVRHRYEPADRGHIAMNATKCCVDLYCPHAELIAHLDADSVFTRDVCPGDWMVDERIALLATLYVDAGDARAWKPLVDRALGWDEPLEYMQSPMLAYWRETYSMLREHIEHVHCMPFCEYALTYHVPEFDTLGAIANRMNDSAYCVTAVDGEMGAKRKANCPILQGWSRHADLGTPESLAAELAKLEAAIA